MIENGVIDGNPWELEWNMLGTNEKMENNLSLLGAEFETILYHIFLVEAKKKEHLAIVIVIKKRKLKKQII
jgi:hypothetical protein